MASSGGHRPNFVHAHRRVSPLETSDPHIAAHVLALTCSAWQVSVVTFDLVALEALQRQRFHYFREPPEDCVRDGERGNVEVRSVPRHSQTEDLEGVNMVVSRVLNMPSPDQGYTPDSAYCHYSRDRHVDPSRVKDCVPGRMMTLAFEETCWDWCDDCKADTRRAFQISSMSCLAGPVVVMRNLNCSSDCAADDGTDGNVDSAPLSSQFCPFWRQCDYDECQSMANDDSVRNWERTNTSELVSIAKYVCCCLIGAVSISYAIVFIRRPCRICATMFTIVLMVCHSKHPTLAIVVVIQVRAYSENSI